MMRKNILKTICILLLATSIVFSSTAAMGNISEVQSPMKAVWLSTSYTSVQPQQAEKLSEIWIHFDDGNNYQGIGMGSGGTWEGAIRMTPGELRFYENWKIVVVKWYHYVVPGTSKTHSGNIKIYSQGEPNLPGNLLTSEPYTVTSEGWCEIPLSNLAYTPREDHEPPITTYTLIPPEPDGNNNWYVSTVTVVLSATDNQSGIDLTAYKIDNGTWKLYAGPFTPSDGNHTVYYYSIDTAGNTEDTKSFKIKIDRTPTATTPKLTGDEGNNDWYVSGVEVELISTDAASGVNVTCYRVDEGGWKEYTNPFTVSDDGECTVYYYSIDKAGNEEDEKSVEFKIDATNPTVSIETPMTGYLYIFNTKIIHLPIIKWSILIGKMTVTVDAQDQTTGIGNVNFWVENLVASDTEEPYEWDWSIISIFAPHILTVIAYDQAGNSARAEIRLFVFLSRNNNIGGKI